MKFLRLLTALLFGLMAISPSARADYPGPSGYTTTTTSVIASQMVPYRDANFLNSIGVNVQLTFGGAGGANWDDTTGATNSSGTAWASAQAKIAYELQWGGFAHIRQGSLEGRTDVIADINYFFAQYGITAFIVQQVDSNVPNISEDMTMIRTATPGAIHGYSGTNEWPGNYTKITYNGTTYYSNGTSAGSSSTVNPMFGVIDNMMSMSALRANVETANMLYIAAAPANLTAYPWTEPFVDGVDWHVYANEGIQPTTNFAGAIAAARASSPHAKIAFVSETGCTDKSNADTSSSYGDCGNAHTQAVSALDAYFSGYSIGGADSEVYWYELMNDVTDTTAGAYNIEHNFGLFNGNGSPKASGSAIHNMTTILADTGLARLTFQPASVPFTVSGLPTGGSSLLLEKSTGVYELVLFNGNATIFSGTSEVTPTAASVVLNFGASRSSVKVYDPITGTTATSSASSISTLTVSLTADPQIVEITL